MGAEGRAPFWMKVQYSGIRSVTSVEHHIIKARIAVHITPTSTWSFKFVAQLGTFADVCVPFEKADDNGAPMPGMLNNKTKKIAP